MRERTGLPYESVFATVYAGLRINLCLALATLPVTVAAALGATAPAARPLTAALSVLCGPAVRGACAAFAAVTDEPQRVGRSFWAGYRAGFAHACRTAAVAAAAVLVLVTDLRLATGTAFAPLTPVLLLLIALVVLVAVTVLASDRPLPARLLLPTAYLALRRWHLGLATLAVLAVLLAAVALRPAVGLLLLPAPALYVAWVNTRHVLAPLTDGPPHRAPRRG
ncbi:hypothetical protein [Kitasatospora purpeofusca]|uniref:hypothetical protein n=1 Tax=Kitasatospora purpeofusca TaxID=67352 RepID=UPI003646C3D7